MSESHKKKYHEPSLNVEDLTSSLYSATQKLNQTIRERDEIFANISHDLRSPITAIHNSIEYLQSLDHITESDIRSALPLLSERTLTLENMINNIFLLTKLDSAESLMKFETIPAVAFLEDFYYSRENDTKYIDRHLTFNVPENLHGCIYIDPVYMQRVLDNLFENALKFTDKGDQITLSAAPLKKGNRLNKAVMHITVENTGKAIAPSDLPNIFNRTYMSSESRTPGSHSGAGLGLSICNSIIQKHNGIIWCESDPAIKKGCSFHIELPLAH